MGNDTISVQVVYALPELIWKRDVLLPTASTIAQALDISGFGQQHPELDVQSLAVGIYGQVHDHAHVLQNGERIEVYRPLVFDPMESRRRRALHRQAFMTKPANRPKRRKAKLAAAQMAQNIPPASGSIT